ncbi:MAG: hypothetical protein JO329_04495 [Planctomycetaceae bacterium]|nr:hypothetical protein [Planctomycetaceae bacterium]
MRCPSRSTAASTLGPLRHWEPSDPARPPPSGEEGIVRRSTNAAVGSGSRPAAHRSTARRSGTMAANRRRRVCWETIC